MRVMCSANKGEMEHAGCLDCALVSVRPPCGMDYSLLSAMYNDGVREGIHVTSLTGCLRRTYLDIKFPAPEYPHEMLTRFLGTAVHAFLEGDDDHKKSEVELEGLGIVGKSDIVYESGRVVDFKTVRWMVPNRLPYGSHAMQVNIYAHLLRLSGRQVTSAAIQYIDMSGPSKCRACKVPVRMVEDGSLACPSCGGAVNGAHLGSLLVEIPLIDDREVEKFITERRDILIDAMQANVLPDAEVSFLCAYCSHTERCEAGRASKR
jgi:CRISPR/Cas system-associated exonuclease Cas4 (RecB family)